MLSTSYSYKIRSSDEGCNIDPDANYNSYSLFCLRTRLLSTMENILGPGFSYNIIPTPEDDLMYLKLQIVNGSVNYTPNSKELSTLQRSVDQIIANYSEQCLIFKARDISFDDGYVISKAWISTMLPYIKYRPDISIKIEGQYVYANLNQFGSYDIISIQIEADIIYNLKEMFLQGYVINPPDFIIKEWQLVKIIGNDDIDDYNELYRPNWSDSRLLFNKLSGFLMSRYENNYQMEFDLLFVNNNWVVRHYIIKILNQEFDDLSLIKFTNDKMILQINNINGFSYQMVLNILAIIEYARNNARGQIIYFSSDSKQIIIDYINILQNLNYNNIAQAIDDNNKYILTILVDLNVDVKMIEAMLSNNLYKVICNLNIKSPVFTINAI